MEAGPGPRRAVRALPPPLPYRALPDRPACLAAQGLVAPPSGAIPSPRIEARPCGNAHFSMVDALPAERGRVAGASE